MSTSSSPSSTAASWSCKSGETKFPNQVGTLRWDGEAAQARMDNILATHYADNRVDAVLSPYDGISRGIIASLKQVGYYTADKPGPVVTGQDAELPSVKSILAGEQTRPCSRTPARWPPRSPKMVDQFLKGQTVDVNDTKTYENGVKIVPSYLLPVVSVTKDNVTRSWWTPATTRPTKSSHRLGSPSRVCGGSTPRTPALPYRSVDRRREQPVGDVLLEMRGITKEFPGVRALKDVSFSVRPRRDPRPRRRERGRQVDPDEGRLSGVYPHGEYEGEFFFDGRGVPLHGHPRQRAHGHRDHPPGARAHPAPLDHREHLPRQRAGRARA